MRKMGSEGGPQQTARVMNGTDGGTLGGDEVRREGGH